MSCTAKFSSVTIDGKLKCVIHISTVTMKANKRLYCIEIWPSVFAVWNFNYKVLEYTAAVWDYFIRTKLCSRTRSEKSGLVCYALLSSNEQFLRHAAWLTAQDAERKSAQATSHTDARHSQVTCWSSKRCASCTPISQVPRHHNARFLQTACTISCCQDSFFPRMIDPGTSHLKT